MSIPNDPKTIADQLCRFARTNLLAPGTDFNEHTPLAEVGIDSFSLVELLLFSERTFVVTVPESHLTHENLASLATLAQCIVRIARASASAPPVAN